MKFFIRMSRVVCLALLVQLCFSQSQVGAACCGESQEPRGELYRARRIDLFPPGKECMADCVAVSAPFVCCGCGIYPLVELCILCKDALDNERRNNEYWNRQHLTGEPPEERWRSNKLKCLRVCPARLLCLLACGCAGAVTLGCYKSCKAISTCYNSSSTGVLEGETNPLVCAIFDDDAQGIINHFDEFIDAPVTLEYRYNYKGYCTSGTRREGYRDCRLHKNADRDHRRCIRMEVSPLAVALLIAREDTVECLLNLIEDNDVNRVPETNNLALLFVNDIEASQDHPGNLKNCGVFANKFFPGRYYKRRAEFITTHGEKPVELVGCKEYDIDELLRMRGSRSAGNLQILQRIRSVAPQEKQSYVDVTEPGMPDDAGHSDVQSNGLNEEDHTGAGVGTSSCSYSYEYFSTSDDVQNNVCPVCLDENALEGLVVKPACGHEICMECYQKMIKEHAETGSDYLQACPQCRKRFSERSKPRQQKEKRRRGKSHRTK